MTRRRLLLVTLAVSLSLVGVSAAFVSWKLEHLVTLSSGLPQFAKDHGLPIPVHRIKPWASKWTRVEVDGLTFGLPDEYLRSSWSASPKAPFLRQEDRMAIRLPVQGFNSADQLEHARMTRDCGWPTLSYTEFTAKLLEVDPDEFSIWMSRSEARQFKTRMALGSLMAGSGAREVYSLRNGTTEVLIRVPLSTSKIVRVEWSGQDSFGGSVMLSMNDATPDFAIEFASTLQFDPARHKGLDSDQALLEFTHAVYPRTR